MDAKHPHTQNRMPSATPPDATTDRCSVHTPVTVLILRATVKTVASHVAKHGKGIGRRTPQCENFSVLGQGGPPSVSSLLSKHRDPGLIPQTHIKSCTQWHVFGTSELGRQKQVDLRGSLATNLVSSRPVREVSKKKNK